MGYNMFAYCNNNPIMFVDNLGYKHVKCALFLGGGKSEFDYVVYEYEYSPAEAILLPFLNTTFLELAPVKSGRIFVYKGKGENDFRSQNYYVPDDFDWSVDILVGDLTDSENPNIHVYQAQNIPRDAWNAVINVLKKHDIIYGTAWDRTHSSLLTEWKWHMKFQRFSPRAQNIDFDNDEEGKGGVYYIWKAFRSLLP